MCGQGTAAIWITEQHTGVAETTVDCTACICWIRWCWQDLCL